MYNEKYKEKLMKIAISAESTIDLPQNLLKQFDIHTIPLFVRLGDEEFIDGTFSCEKIFEYVKSSKSLPKTSAQNEQNYVDYFKELQKNADVVLHLSISSKISSSYDHAVSASKRLKNVFVVDSLSLSTGIALLALYAQKLATEGKLSPEEIVQKVEARRQHNQTSFVLLELNYLYKGGRCNSLQYFGSNLLKIKPQIVMKDGQMQSGKKFVGFGDSVYLKYVHATLEHFNKPDLENVFLTYTTCPPTVIEKIKDILKARGFKNIFLTQAGATITSYCGEGCLGILYFNDGE